jgi:hypothetical protein
MGGLPRRPEQVRQEVVQKEVRALRSQGEGKVTVSEPTNHGRALRARRILRDYGDVDHPDERRIVLSDFLSDMMHLARLSGFDWDEIAERARRYFAEEVEESDSPKDWFPRAR